MNNRKSAKKDIIAKYDSLRMIYESIPIGIAIVDSDTRLISANKALIDLMGGEGIIEIGKQFGDSLRCVSSLINGCGHGEACILCEIRATINRAVNTGLSYHHILLQHEFIINDQEVSPWYQMSFVPITIDDERYVMITVDDVTTLKS